MSLPAEETLPGTDVVNADQLQTAHRYFSASCFNNCWTLLDKTERTPDEIEEMVLLAQASLWHWKQRTDVQPSNLAIGYWQASRAYALAGQYELSKQHAAKSLAVAQEHQLSAFYSGYAFEALARTEVLRADSVAAKPYLVQARAQLEQVTDAEERTLLETDLTQLEKQIAAPR